MNLTRPTLTVTAFLALTGGVVAQSTPPTGTLTFAKASAKAGQVVVGTVTLTFAPGLHGYQNPPSDEYQIPVTVKVVEQGFSLVKADYPKGKDFTLAGESKPAKVYEGTVTIPVRLKASKKTGTYNVNVQVDYQQCNASSCFPPASFVVKGKLTVK